MGIHLLRTAEHRIGPPSLFLRIEDPRYQIGRVLVQMEAQFLMMFPLIVIKSPNYGYKFTARELSP